MNEPTFLDLDSILPPSPTSTTGGTTPATPSAPNVANFNSESAPPPPPPAALDHAPAQDADNSVHRPLDVLLKQSQEHITAAPKLAKSAITNAPNTAIDQAKNTRDHLRDVKVGLSPSNRADEESKEDADALDEEAAQPPEVVYGKDVALDMAGYHNAKAAGEESDEAGQVTPEAGESSRPFPSSSCSPSSTPHLPLPESEQHSYVRGGLAPPEVQVTIPGAGELSTSPPDYTWEWGAFPTRSPARPTFKPLVRDDASVHVGPSHLGQSVTTAEDVDGDSARHKPSSSTAEDESSSSFGKGGQLFPDSTERDMFWVSIEAKRFSFQLSLCDNDEGRRRRIDDLESARWFDDEKVEYARLLADPDFAASEQLVMKWGDRFITKRDNSPLMNALLRWRHNMKPLPEHQPRPPLPSSASDPERSPPISPGLPASNAPMSARDKRASGSSWARWWSRSRAAEQEQEPTAATAAGTTASAIGVPGEGTVTGRPALAPTASAPADLDMPEVPTPASPPMEPAKTAPASINVSTASTISRPESPSAASTTTPPAKHKNYVKTLRLSSDQLKALDLQKGANTITFSLATTGVVACTAKIFVWEETDRVVVSDIDGSITKSDALGHMFNLIGRDWTHLGVAKLYTDIARNGYKMMYLTSRAIGQADSTRDYLKGIKQNNYQLPEGPVIMSPDRLMASLHREVIMRKPEVFKMACLRDIQRLFGMQHKEPFYARFGNRITDALSYRSVNVPNARIFTIDSSGEVKMELLELAGYKSSYAWRNTHLNEAEPRVCYSIQRYIHMTDLVDQMFPPVHKKWVTEFTDFNYWRDPLPEVDLPDLDPPSPALSAVSDASVTSRLSRLRNFSLRSSSSTPTAAAAAAAAARNGRKEVSPSPLVRSIVSDDRSTTLADSASESEEHHRQARRKLSFDSMPGSLPSSEYGGSDGEQEDDGDEEEDEDEDDGDEEDIEEEPVVDDILAEMANVPFI
ncbi:hypothetical protein FRC00_012934 [Tulasnella sp. 408]|nr:hypothetical protein FRC00_012934 [Tulasnella sp. 408]